MPALGNFGAPKPQRHNVRLSFRECRASRRPDYVSIDCGSLDQLPQALARLDAGNRSYPVATFTKETASAEKVGSSLLNAIGRDLIRTEKVERRILAAAQGERPILQYRVQCHAGAFLWFSEADRPAEPRSEETTSKICGAGSCVSSVGFRFRGGVQ